MWVQSLMHSGCSQFNMNCIKFVFVLSHKCFNLLGKNFEQGQKAGKNDSLQRNESWRHLRSEFKLFLFLFVFNISWTNHKHLYFYPLSDLVLILFCIFIFLVDQLVSDWSNMHHNFVLQCISDVLLNYEYNLHEQLVKMTLDIFMTLLLHVSIK